LEIPVLISTHLIFLQPGDNLMTFAGQLASKATPADADDMFGIYRYPRSNS